MGFWTSTVRHLINISYLAKRLVFPRVSVLPVIDPVGWRELSGHHWLSGQFWYRLKVEIVWEWEKKPSSMTKAKEKKCHHDTLSETQKGISHWVFKVAHSPRYFSCCGLIKTGVCWHCRWCPEPMPSVPAEGRALLGKWPEIQKIKNYQKHFIAKLLLVGHWPLAVNKYFFILLCTLNGY